MSTSDRDVEPPITSGVDDDPTITSSLADRFRSASDFIREIAGHLNEDDLLYLYSRYKQATQGPCEDPKPGYFNFQAKAKWSAWSSLRDMDVDTAMTEYIKKVESLNKGWKFESTSKEFTVPKKRDGGFGMKPSTLNFSESGNESDSEESETSNFLTAVKNGDSSRVLELLSSTGPDNISRAGLDDQGLTALHWAVDRGHLEITRALISNGWDVNAQDSEGQTPLHYSTSCGHEVQ